MRYSYDPIKRKKVLEDRGLDLADARQVFEGFYLSRVDTKHSAEEQRAITVGMLNNEETSFLSGHLGLASGASLPCGKPMRKKDSDITNSVIDPDEVKPELNDDWFEEADAFQGAKIVRRGRPKSDNPKLPVTIRLDRDLVDWFKQGGEGWQTRMNEELRKVAGI